MDEDAPPGTSFAMTSPKSPKSPRTPKSVRFKKTHRRNESKISKISHLSIRSLGRGGTIDEEDETDGIEDQENLKPIYLFESLAAVVPWIPRMSLPGTLRVSPDRIKKRMLQYWVDHHTYEDRILVVGNKFSEHLFTELNIDAKKVQTSYGGPQKSNKYCTSKYTIWTFIPYNLYEQFRRLSNMYFLITMVLTAAFPQASPISPWTWVWSLLLIIFLTMVKQGYEDFLRHRSDNQTNKRIVQVLKNGSLKEIHAEDIMVGDIIHLGENEMIPCDMVILSTSQDHGHCYVMTANLDGETTLKTKCASPLSKNLKSFEELEKFVGCIQCENPNPKLDNFLGRMYSFGELNNHIETASLSPENLLLTGTQLKNTKEVYGVCVYAGQQTKISLNSMLTHNKFSSVERSLNRYLLAFAAILVIELVFSTAMTLEVGVEYINSTAHLFNQFVDWSQNPTRNLPPNFTSKENLYTEEYHWYIIGDKIGEFKNAKNGLYAFFGWMVIYNYIIPISLFLCVEIQKFFGSMFVQWDKNLRDDKTDEPAIVRTSDINEELGLITHLFSDKTGTLTKNEMIFRQYCHDAKLYDMVHLQNESYNLMLMGMTLCHSVQYTSGHFVASSPDEQAIVEACSRGGFSFCGEELDGTLTVCAKDKVLTYKKLVELQFDSYRKCMSVIVRPKHSSDENLIYVFVKGAESSMFPICSSGPVEETKKVVDQLAKNGLRTLVYGFKIISREELNIFSEKLEAAKQSIVNRIKYVRGVYKDMEKDLTLLGATGIEDKLQDQVVPTIQMMHKAGIVTWMLTGDKKETAVNMAHAVGMVDSSNHLVDLCEVLDRKQLFKLMDEVQRDVSNWNLSKPCVIIDGKAISAISKSLKYKIKLSDISIQCHSIVACRLSPVQKSLLVTMIKEANNSYVTCAIGDGGNDVSMIQEAHIGIGLIGKEGSAASQSADFAITKFCHLQRLVLVHGHWFYTRQAFLVQYSFYKNVACFTCQLIFAFYSNFSTQSLFDSLFLFLFNSVYTFLPVIVYGLTEQKYPDHVLLQSPELYKNNRCNSLMKPSMFFLWLFLGFWHATCSFLPWLGNWQMGIEMASTSGHSCFSLGAVVAATSCTIINLKILLETRFWTWWLILSVVLSLGSYIVLTLSYNAIHYSEVIGQFITPDVFYTYIYMFDRRIVINILVTLISVVIALLPDIIIVIICDMKSRLRQIKKTLPANNQLI